MSDNVEKLIKTQKQIVHCQSCGAEYDIHEPMCPYCGTTNELGAEGQYLKHLEDIHYDLDQMEDYAEQTYEGEAKRTLSKVIKPVIIILLSIGVVFAIIMISLRVSDKNAMKQQRAQLIWQNENFPILDEMIEKGDFKGALDFRNRLYEEDSPYNLWSWKHIEFINAYGFYNSMHELLPNIEDESQRDDLAYQLVFEDAAQLLFDKWDYKLNEAKSIDNSEYDLIMGYQEEAKDILEKYYGLTDLDEIRQNVTEESYSGGVLYSKCEEYLKSKGLIKGK